MVGLSDEEVMSEMKKMVRELAVVRCELELTCPRRRSSSRRPSRRRVRSGSRRTRSLRSRRSVDALGSRNRADELQGKIVRQESINIDAAFERKKKQVQIEKKM